MPQSLAQIYLHVIFATKDRRPFLEDPSLRSRVHSYLAGISKNLGASPLTVGGVEDHVHIVCRLSRTHTVADLIRELKRNSTRWLQDLKPGFAWQRGYGAFSVSPGHLPALRKYVAEQDLHHEKVSFQEEFRRLLEKYDVDYDERYVWD